MIYKNHHITAIMYRAETWGLDQAGELTGEVIAEHDVLQTIQDYEVTDETGNDYTSFSTLEDVKTYIDNKLTK